MAEVFLSYSRRDTAFVQVFPLALRRAVEASDAFVFVISPDSVASPICDQEVDHARELNKRIVPVMRRRVADEQIPDAVRERNWIPFEDDTTFDGGVARLVDALDTDVELARAHSRWLLEALEWEQEDHDRSFLLRGAELAAGERWLAESAGRQPEPTALQREYLFRSRAAATRRLRALAGAMAVALAVAVGLGLVALSQRNDARHQSDIARSRELAAVSESQLSSDPELAILLAAESVRSEATPQAMLALRRALDASSLRLTLRHGGLVRRVVFSPRGGLVATAGLVDGVVGIWSARDGRRVRAIRVGNPNAVAFSPDGATVAVARDSGGSMLFDTATGRQRGAFQPEDHVSDIRYSADGRSIVTAGLGFVKLWDADSLRLRRSFKPQHDLAIRAVLSPDGRRVAAATQSGVRIWDTRTGRLQRMLPGGEDAAIAFAPDGRTLAFGSEGRRVRVLDVPGRGKPRTLARLPAGMLIAVAFSPDGSLLASGSTDGVARLWHVATGRPAGRLEGHRCCVNDVAFNRDGSLLATSSKDQTAKVWATRGDVRAEASVGARAVTGLAVARDGRVYVAASGLPISAWFPGHAPVRLRAATGAQRLALSPDGSTLAVAQNGITVPLVDTATGRVTRTLQAHSTPDAIAFDRHGALLAVGGPAGATIFRPATAAIVGELDSSETVRDAAFDPRGDALALAAETGSEAGTVSLWRPSGRLPFAELPEQKNRVTLVAFSPDGSLLVTAEDGNSAVEVWDVHRRREARELLGHEAGVTAAAFSPDGRLLATAGGDRMVRVWDPRTGRQLRAIRHDRPVTAVTFNADGGTLITGDDRGTVRATDACTGCLDPAALLAVARHRVTRSLTPVERATFLGGGG